MSNERKDALRQMFENDGFVYGKDFTDETLNELTDGNQRPEEPTEEKTEETEE